MAVTIADVAEFQQTINWAAYGAVNPAAIVRVHNSNRADYYAAANIAGARAHCRWRGFYQYLTAGADPSTAAHAMQATLGPTLPGEVMIVDIEEGSGDQTGRRAAWLAALQDPVEWTYSGLAFARASLADKVDWVAAYGQGEPTDAHTLWQYTDKQIFAGISAPCDGSVYSGTIDQLIALTQGAVPDMTPEQAAQLAQIAQQVSGLDFAFNNGQPQPYTVRGEIPARLRTIDGHTIAQPVAAADVAIAVAAKVPTADAIAVATAAKVGSINVQALASAVVTALGPIATPATTAEVAKAVRDYFAANPLR
jgi:hypothetical protein